MHGIGAKLIADAVSEAGHDIATACDLYIHLQQHLTAPKNYYQIFCIKKTVINFSSAFDWVIPYYCWTVKTNLIMKKTFTSANSFALATNVLKVLSIIYTIQKF